MVPQDQAHNGGPWSKVEQDTRKYASRAKGAVFVITGPGVRRQVITPIDAPEHFQKEAVVERSARKQVKDSPSIRALGLAHYWQRLLDEGKYQSLTEIAVAEGMDRGQVTRTAQLVRLAPEIVESCLSEGRCGPKLETLARVCLADAWPDQSLHIPSGLQGRQSRF